MSTDLQNAEGLIAALTPLESVPAADALRLLHDAVRVYRVAFRPDTPDTTTWTAGWSAAFGSADATIRYGLGAATESTSGGLTPSPGSPYSYGTDLGTYTAMIGHADAALAALAAPSNGVDPAVLAPVAELVQQAKAALTAAYGAGLPNYSTSQTDVAAGLSARIWSARAVAAMLNVTWTPGP